MTCEPVGRNAAEYSGAKKRWNINSGENVDREAVSAIARELDILPATAFLLYIRGYRDPASASAFISRENASFRDPYQLADMDKAVERLRSALESREKIAVYGDYDVDGVTAVSVLFLYLKFHGADVSYYIPCRSGEGYGVSEAAVRSLADEGVKLIITVDTGITACAEIALASSLGVDVIVTDHHECHCELPAARAVVNPRRQDSVYPFRELAGVGVVFKFICAAESALTGRDCIKELCVKYSDLVAIGTIADVMPLTDENRLIVSVGLKLLEQNPRPGIAALLDKSGVSTSHDKGGKCRRIDSTLIGFVIAPRLNAAGRLKKAGDAVELLLAESRYKADALAMSLCETNSERQEQERIITKQAYEMIAAGHDFEHDKVIVLAEDGWHHGVIGIVASRITEKYNLPSILISFDGDTGKGSGRSVKGLNLVEALSACGDYLLKFGGHELAAGLTIERSHLDDFKRAINAYAAEHLTDEELTTSIDIDEELFEGDLTLRQASELRYLEPYGIANPTPLFILRSAELLEISGIGGGKHTRMTVKSGNTTVSAVKFGSPPSSFDLLAGDTVDIVFNLSVNEFQNTKSVQLIIRDIGLCEGELERLGEQRKIYEALRDGSNVGEGDYLPAREEFASVYRYIRRETGKNGHFIYFRAICRGADDINPVKLRFILDIFNEANLMSVDTVSEDPGLLDISVNSTGGKICLEHCGVYKKLRRTLRREGDS